MVVIVGRIRPDRIEDGLIGVGTGCGEEVLIGCELSFFFVRQTVESHVLLGTAAL